MAFGGLGVAFFPVTFEYMAFDLFPLVNKHRQTSPDDAPYRHWWGKALILFVLVILVGDVFAGVLEGHFIFFPSSAYWENGKWAVVFLIPVCILTFIPKHSTAYLRIEYPNSWVRRLIIYPILAISMAAMVVFAPFGYIAANAYFGGDLRKDVLAKILSVDSYRANTKWCDQKAKIEVANVVSNICLEGLVAQPLKGNQMVILEGRQTQYGLYVQAVSLR